jgi:hypothetical protein
MRKKSSSISFLLFILSIQILFKKTLAIPFWKNRRKNRNHIPKLSSKMNREVKDSRSSLGDVLCNADAAAFNSFRSLEGFDSSKIRVAFCNQTNERLILCWVSSKGKLCHYYTLEPASLTITKLGRGSSELQFKQNPIHVESTGLGHAFVIGNESLKKAERQEKEESDSSSTTYFSDDSSGELNKLSMKAKHIVAAYRPMLGSLRQNQRTRRNAKQSCVHMVTITESQITRERKSHDLRKEYYLTICEGIVDNTPLDTSDKVYREENWGGWMIKCEQGLFENDGLDHVKARLIQDIEAASEKLPIHARTFLQKTTPIWINRHQQFGPQSLPTSGLGMCFHPGKDWLIENGMSSEKCGGVELYETSDYLSDADLWHTGGVILHELSHAWHCKHVKDGYENEEILKCYQAAMECGLYDRVKVHCLDGSVEERRAYACQDAMEYFAELSVAYLGGAGKEKDIEYNKWYPFNRKQLLEHDKRAHTLLEKIWGNCSHETSNAVEEESSTFEEWLSIVQHNLM